MGTKLVDKQDTRTVLIQVGMDVMLEKGYTNTGIQEVLNVANVPKGSFYHYFDSKELFAVAIIQYFDSVFTSDIQKTLLNTQRSSIERLNDYCESARANLVSHGCSRGCLLGNLSQEMADQSEVLRKELCIVMTKWREMFATCIGEGQRSGEIKSLSTPHKLAELFLAAWSGAVMRAKTLKNTESLDVFMELMFTNVLQKAA